MKLTFKNLKNFINIFFIIAIAYFFANINFFFLEKIPSFEYPYKKMINFYDIDISDLFFQKPKKIEKKKAYSFKFSLIGIYNDNKKGFIILKDKNKNIFVDLGKTYKGYKLIKINLTNVIFEKNNKKYILNIKNIKQTKSKEKVVKKVVYPKKIINKIDRSLIRYYKRNLRFIWQNIGINQTQEGYKVTYINPTGLLAKLGLRKGDVLLEVNGVKLKNDSDAWNLFNNINKFDEIKIIIERNNKRKVLRYEIENN